MKILDLPTLCTLIRETGLGPFLDLASAALQRDLRRWKQFRLTPRHATHYPHGVIELMPCADARYYACKYVNGHPGNSRHGRLTVVACGLLADVASGYPLMIAEMTLLTAIRTAVASAVAASYLCRPQARRLAVIGTGAQAEFQVRALTRNFDIESVAFYDPDADAMQKFAVNLERTGDERLRPADSVREAAFDADLVVTATADKARAKVLDASMIRPGTHIQAIGGDCPGKTEIDPELLANCRIVVELLEQTRVEGEIQNLPDRHVHAELWELVSGLKGGRASEQEITLFDAVGCALEDYSILRLVYELAERGQAGDEVELLPEPKDPKNLFALLGGA